jgi:hypothetical protein
MGKRVPPVSAVSPFRKAISVPQKWPTEIKDMEKGVIIEGVDRCSTWSVAYEPYSETHKYSRRRKRTSAIGNRRILHAGGFFEWTDDGM